MLYMGGMAARLYPPHPPTKIRFASSNLNIDHPPLQDQNSSSIHHLPPTNPFTSSIHLPKFTTQIYTSNLLLKIQRVSQTQLHHNCGYNHVLTSQHPTPKIQTSITTLYIQYAIPTQKPSLL